MIHRDVEEPVGRQSEDGEDFRKVKRVGKRYLWKGQLGILYSEKPEFS